MIDPPKPVRPYTPTLHLLFSSPNVFVPEKPGMINKILAFEPAQPDLIDVQWQRADSQQPLGTIRFETHEIKIAGLPHPLPPAIIDRTVHTALWGAQTKAAMRQHQSHLSLVYTGDHPDPAEQMLALYKTASCFLHENLLGVANENAWTAHPVADFLNPEKILDYRDNIPFHLWVGYVKFFIDKTHFWLVSKGHHIFDVPDLAYLTTPKEDIDAVIHIFINLFHYIYEADGWVAAGDTLTIQPSGESMKFSEVPENLDFLMGPSGTLVVEKTHP